MKTVDELLAFSMQVDGQGVNDNINCTYMAAELRALANAVVGLPKGACIVEIGVFTGRSASLYLQLQQELDFDIRLIDNWSWNQAEASRAFGTLILENFNEVPFTLYKMRSDYLGTYKWSGRINLLHVDGWHDMPGIEPDCILWLPWVKENGFAVFHDSDYPPVATCIDRYVKNRGWTLVESAGRTTVWRKPCSI